MDKIYTRHNMVIILQGGLIQVYQVLPVLQLLYCKSVEDPEQEDDHEDEFYISTDHLEQGYKPRRAIKYTDLDITISTQVSRKSSKKRVKRVTSYKKVG